MGNEAIAAKNNVRQDANLSISWHEFIFGHPRQVLFSVFTPEEGRTPKKGIRLSNTVDEPDVCRLRRTEQLWEKKLKPAAATGGIAPNVRPPLASTVAELSAWARQRAGQGRERNSGPILRRSRSTFSNGLSRPDPFECGRAGPGGTLSTVLTRSRRGFMTSQLSGQGPKAARSTVGRHFSC